MQPGVGASRTGHPDPGVQAVRRTGPAEQRALGFLRAIGQALQPGPLAQVQQVAAVLARQAGDGQAGRQVLGVFEADVGRSRRQAGRRGGGEGRPGALGGVFLAQRAGVVALRCECIEEALAVGGADHVQVQAVVFVQAFHQRQSQGFQLLAEGWQEILGKVVAQALQQRLQCGGGQLREASGIVSAEYAEHVGQADLPIEGNGRVHACDPLRSGLRNGIHWLSPL